jgi:pimeloyl-ACP methyl ester carboxylesterase
VTRLLSLLLLSASAGFGETATVQFPSDLLTTPDDSQITGKRVNLPLPDCMVQAPQCAELTLANQLDGFSVRPRIAVAFSGAVDTTTLRGGMFLIELSRRRRIQPIGVNQVAWDPATNTAYAKSDAVLHQHERYLLIITDALHDAAGIPLTADPTFSTCLQSTDLGYCNDLAQALGRVAMRLGAHQVIGASLFTTQSATAWLESARRQLQTMPVVAQRPEVVDLSTYQDLTANFDGGKGVVFSATLPIGDPSYALLFGSLGRMAFGFYRSPDVLNDQQTIDTIPTATEVTLPTPTSEVAFHIYLPKASAPAQGYPVVIFGHGFGDSSIGVPTIVAPRLAADGFATIAINAFGHGFGPQSNITFNGANGATKTFLLGGRGIDRNRDGVIESSEGCDVLTPAVIGIRDCLRQTVVDLLQLVRVIRAGIDIDGDGTPDLDASRIYYVGQSLGSLYGTMLNALEPSIRAAAFNTGGGSVVDIYRWSPSTATTLAAFFPTGTTIVDNFPFRDQQVSVNPPGASDTQNFLELIEWLDNTGDPIAFAPHVRRAPLEGVTVKPVLFQMARGDEIVPNPASTALSLAMGVEKSTWLYRHDLARQAFPSLPEGPHTYLALFLGIGGGTVSLPSLPAILIGLAAQSQIAGFLSSDGKTIPDMKDILPGPLFEIPASLPNDLGIQTTGQTKGGDRLSRRGTLFREPRLQYQSR